MTVGELIEVLTGLPAAALVTVDAYESGVTAEFEVREGFVRPSGDTASYFGEYDFSSERPRGRDDGADDGIRPAVNIGGRT